MNHLNPTINNTCYFTVMTQFLQETVKTIDELNTIIASELTTIMQTVDANANIVITSTLDTDTNTVQFGLHENTQLSDAAFLELTTLLEATNKPTESEKLLSILDATIRQDVLPD